MVEYWNVVKLLSFELDLLKRSLHFEAPDKASVDHC
jgi:hypothetical protein